MRGEPVGSLKRPRYSRRGTSIHSTAEKTSSRKPSFTHRALVKKRSACPRYERGHGDRYYPYPTKLRLQSGYEGVKRKEVFE